MNKKNVIFSIILLCLGILTLTAQESFTTAGGEASGSGGSSSYSAGQVVYSTNTGNGYTVTQGVQQPYEISVITGLRGTESINIEISAFPNPVSDVLTLRIEKIERGDNYSIILYDINGRNLITQDINTIALNINIGEYQAGSYFLKVINRNKEIKTFKIIKN